MLKAQLAIFRTAIAEKLNVLIKKPFNFREKKPKKDFVQTKINRKPGLNIFLGVW